jgi:uncharacterized protein YdaU (DUF1376 family)
VKFYKRFPDSALAGMAELTLEQVGAYNLILDVLYSRDGIVPDDDVLVGRLIGRHWRTWRVLKEQLIAAGKIQITADGLITANRVSDTLREAQRVSQEQRIRVSKRWAKGGSKHRAKQPQELKNAKHFNETLIRAGNTIGNTIDREIENNSSINGESETSEPFPKQESETRSLRSLDGSLARHAEQSEAQQEVADEDADFGAVKPANNAEDKHRGLRTSPFLEASWIVQKAKIGK